MLEHPVISYYKVTYLLGTRDMGSQVKSRNWVYRESQESRQKIQISQAPKPKLGYARNQNQSF